MQKQQQKKTTINRRRTQMNQRRHRRNRGMRRRRRRRRHRIYRQLKEQGANVELILYKGKHKIGIECLRKIKNIIQS